MRRVVDPVCVLEDDERRHHQHAEQELLDRPEEALAPERRLDLLGLRCHRHFGVEGNREQREPGRELGHHGLDPGLQAIAGLGRALRFGDSRERAQQRAKRQVGDGHPVLVAARDELREADRHGLQLFDEARFADPRLPDELGHLALAQACCSDGRLEVRQLALAADDRQLLRSLLLRHTGDDADAVGRDRSFLPFDQERLRLRSRSGSASARAPRR